jgi:nitrogen fixation NifU-like protein
MDDKLKRDIILEHYQSPFHKGLVDNDNYIKVNGRNASCVDNIDVMVLLEDDVIIDARFDGDACAICTSAASIMIKTLIGKNITEAKDIVNNYNNMINEKEYDSSKLEELIVYDTVYKQPNRKNCALLPFRAVGEILDKK